MKKYFSKSVLTQKPSRLYIIIPIILLMSYAAFLVGRAILQHFAVNRELETVSQNIEDLQDKSKRLSQAIEYYKSTNFKEKEARAKLGYQKKGEHVIALPVSSLDKKKTEDSQDILGIETEPSFSQPNYIRWWNFLFKGNK